MVNDDKLIFDFIKPSKILRVNRCIKEYFLLKPQKKDLTNVRPGDGELYF